MNFENHKNCIFQTCGPRTCPETATCESESKRATANGRLIGRPKTLSYGEKTLHRKHIHLVLN